MLEIQSVRKWFLWLWLFLPRDALSYTYIARTNWMTNWKSFVNSNLSLIKFNVSAASGSSNIKPIFDLLPHAVENFLISVAQASLIRVLSSCSDVGSGGRRHCPSQSPTKINPSMSDQAISVIGNKTLAPSTNWWLTWGTLPVLLSKLSLRCNNRFRFMKC
jgi:hypothetical protein